MNRVKWLRISITEMFSCRQIEIQIRNIFSNQNNFWIPLKSYRIYRLDFQMFHQAQLFQFSANEIHFLKCNLVGPTEILYSRNSKLKFPTFSIRLLVPFHPILKFRLNFLSSTLSQRQRKPSTYVFCSVDPFFAPLFW